MSGLSRAAPMAVVLAVLCLAGCDRGGSVSSVGDARRGAQLIGRLGCGSCHVIPGIAGADGQVGPPLTAMARRTIVAGKLPNTPDNMVTWLRAPQSVVPGNAMPDLELDAHDAHDIAAYLYTLR